MISMEESEVFLTQLEDLDLACGWQGSTPEKIKAYTESTGSSSDQCYVESSVSPDQGYVVSSVSPDQGCVGSSVSPDQGCVGSSVSSEQCYVGNGELDQYLESSVSPGDQCLVGNGGSEQSHVGNGESSSGDQCHLDSSPEQDCYVEVQQEVHSQNLEFLGGELGGGGGKLGALGLKDKLCLVCGDKALGYNFNAVSCESCKAFFRRNAFKEIRGRCEGQCDVTVESRSYCKKCRLKKCFTIGMKRDLILNDNQKHVRRQKIHENRLRRQGLPYEPLPPPPPPPPCSSSSQSPTPPPLPPPPIKLEPEKVTHEIAREVDSTDLESVSAVAQQRISEVMKAFKVSFDAPVDHSLPSTPSGVEFLNLADASVRRLVKMAKHLTSFRSLDQEDQISLLKGAVVEVLILRSTKMFDTQNSGWMVPKGGSKLTVQAEGLAKANEESMSFFQQYQRFTMGFLQAIRNDNIILMLIIVLTVLSPDRSNLKAREEIESTQEGYASVLKEYCEKKYPADPLMFAKVLQKLADIRDVNETHTRMLNYMKVDELEPLIVEIFDMNSTNS